MACKSPIVAKQRVVNVSIGDGKAQRASDICAQSRCRVRMRNSVSLAIRCQRPVECSRGAQRSNARRFEKQVSAKAHRLPYRRTRVARAMYASILAGGSGTRLWPLSTKQSPKQFLRLPGPRTMLEETVERLA